MARGRAKKAVEKKHHGILLGGWLILMMMANLLVALFYLFGTSALTKALPGIPSLVFYLYGVLAALNVVLAFLIFRWKKKAFWGFAIVVAVIFILNIAILRSGTASLAGLLGLVILYLLLRPKWRLLE
jgi:hypothetical protein